jgi:uncharacterized protein (TIGR03067 family)
MKRPWFLVLLAGLLVAAGVPKKDEALQKELERMAGTWAVVAHEVGGQKQNKEMVEQANVRLIVKGTKYIVFFGEQQVTQGTLKLDPTAKPKTIDAVADDGPTKGEAMPGIYELEGDSMRVVFAQPGEPRPTEFRTRAGTNQIMIQYKRVK